MDAAGAEGSFLSLTLSVPALIEETASQQEEKDLQMQIIPSHIRNEGGLAAAVQTQGLSLLI